MKKQGIAAILPPDTDAGVRTEIRAGVLSESDYARADAILQVTAEEKTPAPKKALLDAVQKRRDRGGKQSASDADAIPSPTVATLENGATVARLVWPKQSDVFARLTALRGALSPLLEANPATLALDIRPPNADAGAKALFAAMVCAAQTTGGSGKEKNPPKIVARRRRRGFSPRRTYTPAAWGFCRQTF